MTFAIGGPDVAAFQLSGSTVQFRQVPDFERPADSNRDNVYNLTVTAQDSRGASSTADVTITVTNSKEGIAVTRIATGFTDPAAASFLVTRNLSNVATTGQIAIARTNGEIYDVDGATGARTLRVDIFAGRPRGRLLAMTFKGGASGFYSGLYAIGQEPGGRVFLQRYTVGSIEELEILPNGSAQVAASLFTGPANSGQGGNLYMTVSDESGTSAQDPASPLGKLIFLEEQDPFAGASVRPGFYIARIIGSGIRRSGGAGAFNGEILLSDQGGSFEQELTSFLPNARPLDFGWPGREGTRGIGANPPAAVNGPRLVYGFGNGPDQGTGIIYGGLYRGPIADLDNRFVFGDRSGTFWSVKFADLASGSLLGLPQLDRRTQDFVPTAGLIESPVAFAIDDQGRMFILDSDGELFRVDPA
ncbi:hypothetical protein IP79_04680 [Porphyrobacter sp. AAP60]|nr:hypothetical protein IP79_04680 [Porphyrobacter sp. AAP60]